MCSPRRRPAPRDAAAAARAAANVEPAGVDLAATDASPPSAKPGPAAATTPTPGRRPHRRRRRPRSLGAPRTAGRETRPARRRARRTFTLSQRQRDARAAPVLDPRRRLGSRFLQPLNGGRATIYSHLYVTQKGRHAQRGPGSAAEKSRRCRSPAPSTAGSSSSASPPRTRPRPSRGYEENFMDMVGLYTDGDPKKQGIPFTAGHRKSARERERDEKPLDQGRPPASTGRPPGGGIPPR